ncbi:Ppx/GppA family phosphatase [Alphaproteobacteria bacterium KMM 3653]|uniref:Ppx/GppA family phosphatase n=1 Tax=Harenicola maris TaxID=2841044 RepID=A0AAP2G9N9_9RHOB|nr:Ppx/GppA family phosphatase [Harenicola maris]
MNTGADQPSDWGPFGRPLFNDPDVRALSRVGVIDVGSNSVRMVVFDGAARSPAYFYNEKLMCGLGAGMGETGMLNPEGRERALLAMKRFVRLAEGMGIPPMTAVATAAVRNASDGKDFCDEVKAETGLDVYIIDGEEEARLSAQGVLLGWPRAEGLACDIGGSSMELAQVSGGDVGARVSTSLGPLRLKTIKGGAAARRIEIDRVLEDVAQKVPPHERLFLVGGSWRAIARLDMLRRGYKISVLHEYRMTPKSVSSTLRWIKGKNMEELRAEARLSADRIKLVPIAGEVLKRVIKIMKVRTIHISSYGIREGMLYEQMPPRLRARDPLIEACRFEEVQNARVPGFGRTMYHFIQPLFPSARPELRRLVKAACLLHDVSWRAHPDYRGELCFDNTTRSNLGGINHTDRVFLGLALLYRYRGNSHATRFEHLLDILTEKQRYQAEVLGRAMRLGAMFSINAPELMGSFKYHPKKGILKLSLPEGSADLYGEVAEARFNNLAAVMNVETEVLMPKTRRGRG